MNPKGKHCPGCVLEHKGQGFAGAVGEPKLGVMLVGESLGEREAQRGMPFVGDAGYQLMKNLGRGSMRREDFLIGNTVNCRPPLNKLEGTPLEYAAVSHCRPYLYDTLRKWGERVKVLVPMGNTALHALIGEKEVLRRRGYVWDLDVPEADWSGYVVPSLHPSFILRGAQHLVGTQVFDFQRAITVAREGPPEYNPFYLMFPNQADVRAFVEEAFQESGKPDSWMTADIETVESVFVDEDLRGEDAGEIVRISFSFRPGYAITMPWTPGYLPFIQELLLLPFPFIIFWNWRFDVPRIKSQGLLIRPKILEGMDLWHFLQSKLPRNLAFVSSFFTKLRYWKDQNEEYPELYSCADSDAQITNCAAIRDALGLQRFDTFVRHMVDLLPIMVEMGDAGIPVDLDERSKLRAELKAELEPLVTEAQAAVPPEARPTKLYKMVPKEFRCGACKGKGYTKKTRTKKGEKFVEIITCGACNNGAVPPASDTGEWRLSTVEKRGEDGVVRALWERVDPFNPASPHQVIAYAKYKGHPVKRHHETKSETMDEKALRTLANRYKKDVVYRNLLEIRKLQKVISTYMEYGGGDGICRTVFTQKPSTLRFASESPNVQNIPARGPMAPRVRRMFRPPPGHALVGVDYSGIEAVLVGYYAGDEAYIRAAKLGIHAILASHVLAAQGKRREPIDHVGWSDADIAEAVREVKRGFPEIYALAKVVTHSSSYLGTPRKLRIEYPDVFESEARAEYFQKMYFDTIAQKVRQWQFDLLMLAHRQCWIENAWGYRHWFWDVVQRFVRPSPKEIGDLLLGTEAKAVPCFQPQSTAAAITKEAILELARHSFYRRALRWQIHDELLFVLPADGLLEERIGFIRSVMESPWPQLGGISIGTEVKVSTKNWGEMEEV